MFALVVTSVLLCAYVRASQVDVYIGGSCTGVPVASSTVGQCNGATTAGIPVGVSASCSGSSWTATGFMSLTCTGAALTTMNGVSGACATATVSVGPTSVTIAARVTCGTSVPTPSATTPPPTTLAPSPTPAPAPASISGWAFSGTSCSGATLANISGVVSGQCLTQSLAFGTAVVPVALSVVCNGNAWAGSGYLGTGCSGVPLLSLAGASDQCIVSNINLVGTDYPFAMQIACGSGGSVAPAPAPTNTSGSGAGSISGASYTGSECTGTPSVNLTGVHNGQCVSTSIALGPNSSVPVAVVATCSGTAWVGSGFIGTQCSGTPVLSLSGVDASQCVRASVAFAGHNYPFAMQLDCGATSGAPAPAPAPAGNGPISGVSYAGSVCNGTPSVNITGVHPGQCVTTSIAFGNSSIVAALSVTCSSGSWKGSGYLGTSCSGVPMMSLSGADGTCHSASVAFAGLTFPFAMRIDCGGSDVATPSPTVAPSTTVAPTTAPSAVQVVGNVYLGTNCTTTSIGTYSALSGTCTVIQAPVSATVELPVAVSVSCSGSGWTAAAWLGSACNVGTPLITTSAPDASTCSSSSVDIVGTSYSFAVQATCGAAPNPSPTPSATSAAPTTAPVPGVSAQAWLGASCAGAALESLSGLVAGSCTVVSVPISDVAFIPVALTVSCSGLAWSGHGYIGSLCSGTPLISTSGSSPSQCSSSTVAFGASSYTFSLKVDCTRAGLTSAPSVAPVVTPSPTTAAPTHVPTAPPTPAPTPAPTQLAVQSSITLNRTFPATDSERAALIEDFITQVAQALGVAKSRISVTGISSGSVVVNFELLPSPQAADDTPLTLYNRLQSQLQNSTSPIRTSSLTSTANPSSLGSPNTVSRSYCASTDTYVSASETCPTDSGNSSSGLSSSAVVGGAVGVVVVLAVVGMLVWRGRKKKRGRAQYAHDVQMSSSQEPVNGPVLGAVVGQPAVQYVPAGTMDPMAAQGVYPAPNQYQPAAYDAAPPPYAANALQQEQHYNGHTSAAQDTPAVQGEL